MGSILNESDRTALMNRMHSLTASSTAQGGKMNCVEMLRHLRLSAQMATGELAGRHLRRETKMSQHLDAVHLPPLRSRRGSQRVHPVHECSAIAFIQDRTHTSTHLPY